MSRRRFVLALSVCGLVLTCALFAVSQSPSTATQADDQTFGIPKFYAESRQIIVEAEVWDKKYNSTKYWIGNEPIGNNFKFYLRQHLYPPSRGLQPKDFQVLDGGAEQKINYFKEADFPAVDVTDHWYFWPGAHGTWGQLQDQCTRARAIMCGVVDTPSATYLIGCAPPPTPPGECRTIKVAVQGHDVELNRNKYCALKADGAGDIDSIAGPKLAAAMRKFAKSSAHGSVDVSMQAATFWASGVLSLLKESSSNGNVPTINTDFTYVVEVHDSDAPATVHVAATFDFPEYA